MRLMMSQKNNLVSWYNTCENLSSNFKLGLLTKRAPEPDDQDDSVMSLVNLGYLVSKKSMLVWFIFLFLRFEKLEQ